MADNRLPRPYYGPTLGNYSIATPSPPDYSGRLQTTDVYVEDLNCLSQGSPYQQRRVTEMVLQVIKDIFPYLPLEIKDYVSLKKAQEGDGYWAV